MRMASLLYFMLFVHSRERYYVCILCMTFEREREIWFHTYAMEDLPCASSKPF